jgi:hypothetical protein
MTSREITDSCTNSDFKFETFRDMIKRNINWFNGKVESNSWCNKYESGLTDETGTYWILPDDTGTYGIWPDNFNKELIIKLNNLGFLTADLQGGFFNDGEENNYEYEIKERAYICGYIETSIAKKLQQSMNYDDKYFQYVPIKNITICSLDHQMKCTTSKMGIPVTMGMNIDTNEVYVAHRIAHRIGYYEYLIVSEATKTLSHDLCKNYSFCYSWDPLFGVLYDDKDNGLVTKLCNFLEQLHK